MEDADFVPDSDEDEQEMVEALALAEERLTRQKLEAANVTAVQEQKQEPRQQMEEKVESTASVVTPENLPTVEEQPSKQEALEEEEEEEEVTDEEQQDEEQEQEQEGDVAEEDGVLEVGEFVEVESRTWPGINKQGGAGRVARVHREKAGDGDAEKIFYDVRYVLGGFERHIDSEYVHSSELLIRQSNRKKIDREYYHDGFINEPHLKKQREVEEKRERMMARSEQNEAHVPTSMKGERPQRSSRAVRRKRTQSRHRDVGGHEHQEGDADTAFIQPEGDPTEVPEYVDHKTGEQLKRKRNRHQDAHEHQDEDADAAFIQPEGDPTELPEDVVRETGLRLKRKRRRRRYVGGYEHQGGDADAAFIQPEGDPTELPEDVVRETGLQLKKTTHGLMTQLQKIFIQQQKNIADFHTEQNMVDLKMKDLSGMPLNDLKELHRKVLELDKMFLTKTLVNAGEDAMDTIIKTLEKRRKVPAALEPLDGDISKWKEELKDCARWVHHAKDAVDNAFARRSENIPIVQVAQPEYSSDSGESSYSASGYGVIDFQKEGSDSASENDDFSFDFEPETVSATGYQNRQRNRGLKVGTRRPNVSKAVNQRHRKKIVTSTTLDDYFSPQGPRGGFRSNLRLIGRQKKILPSDPRFNWVKLARKKQQRAPNGTGERSVGSASIRISNGIEITRSTKKARSANVSSHDDSVSVQEQRMNLREKRLRAQRTQHRSREAVFARSASQNVRGSYKRPVYPAGIAFDTVTSEKRLLPAEPVNPTMHSSTSKQHTINWESVFEAVSDDSSPSNDRYSIVAISRQQQEALLAFGYPICGPLVPHHLLLDEEYGFKNSDNFWDVVRRRATRLRQLVNDLRLQENNFMDSLSRGGLGAVDDEGYANAPEWILLVSLEEAYHRAIARFAAQLLEAINAVSPSDLPKNLQIVLEEIAALIRQLPDCDSLFTGCKAYFFFFEVASRDAATTPLLTAVSRTYWYCLSLLMAIQSTCGGFVGPHAAVKQEIEGIFLKTLPVSRVTLAVVLYLFDLYVYLPSSHRLEDGENDNSSSGPQPALSLWMLVRGCNTSSPGLDQSNQESSFIKQKDFWPLMQTVYRQHYFDELSRCFVRSESCGGYLRDSAPKATGSDDAEDCDEVFESQLLALEATWDLLVVLTRIFGDPDSEKHQEAVCDARWALVKDLLHPDKHGFLPFNLSDQLTYLQSGYRQRACTFKKKVLQRIAVFSKQWRPSKDVIELILHELWDNDETHHPDDIVELPQLLKQYITRCKALGNSRSQLTSFAGEGSDADPDATTLLCRIIWIQILKLEKRVHRSRFRSSILNAIPHAQEASTASAPRSAPQKSETVWIWGPEKQAPASSQPVKQPQPTLQRPPASVGAGKERLRTSVLLTFAVIGVCMECGEEQQFPIERSGKDVRYMEREVDFYCKEIIRWTSAKPECEVLAAQSLFTLGALLLEKNSAEFPIVFGSLNERLESSMKYLQANPAVSPAPKKSRGTNSLNDRSVERRQRFQNAAMSSLYQMRDLIKKVLEIPYSGVRIGPAYGTAVEKSLEHVFSAGMVACLNGAIHKAVAVEDLMITMEIFQLVLPRAPDNPKQCSALVSTPGGFDDMDDELAGLDLEGLLAQHNTATPAPVWTVQECRVKVIQLITNNLRVVLQQLVLNYPSSDSPTFDELYAVDLLGMMISTCEFQFFWSNVTSASVRPRNLASRVLSAALKYNPEKEWLGNVFLRDSGADKELATGWLLGTLDASALNTTEITFEVLDALFSIGMLPQATKAVDAAPRVRNSDSWVMLTDGIIYHMLRKDPVGFCTMDLQILQLLREVASTCKFPDAIRTNEDGLHDVAALYDLHLDVFQSFCRSAGATWRSYTDAPSRNWDKMNQFRIKMVNPPSGIFVSFLEAYKINFRRACSEIDKVNHDWHSYAELFLRQAGVNATDGRSYHQMDDTIKSFDKRFTGLTTMFRFMYQCMDAFLFYCGEMAIGESNLFLNAMELLFRQVNSAEYPQAIKRLEYQRQLDHRAGVRNVNDELRKDFCPAAMRFVDSIQLFFARQKYPSLLHWFAQTSEIYQTFKGGWCRSPLRTLLVNILDPDGPLGIHSYYPGGITMESGLDVKTVRREAFYLACGLFKCRCTKSFEHSRVQPAPSCTRLQQLREFVLDDFMRETFSYVLQEATTSLLETLVPLCQFVRAVLNHANLNIKTHGETSANSPAHHEFQLSELYPCLEWMVVCLIKLVPGEEAVDSTICCVLLSELCGIVCEAISFNEHRPLQELTDLVGLALSYLQTIYLALSKKTTAMLGKLFAASVDLPPSVKLRAYRFSLSAFRDIVVEERLSQVKARQIDLYGISLARTATDLLAAIGRVAQQCKASSDERIRRFTTVSH